ncbi:hypothetical protein [Embleya sp. NBC_00896]|uniref:hypothetical protein n=1 Tax=Embleya sp. NBC_00896 TaxID=2975961 RepID=UPI002F913487|nr:hypothetical protein OG928_44310 [Embleya sp. NBC_00896]
MANEDDPWIACYQALLPWIERSEDTALDHRARTAVERSLVVVWERIDREATATDADVHAMVAAANAYNQGWFDAVLPIDRGDTRREALWPPSLSDWLVASNSRGRGRAFRDTVGENIDFFGRFDFRWTLELVGEAASAAQAATGTPRERAARAVVDVLQRAWAKEDKQDWDDAEWYQYIAVGERVGWAVAALEVPGLIPYQVADRAVRIAEGYWDGNDGWSARTSPELPAPFLAGVAQAVADCVPATRDR